MSNGVAKVRQRRTLAPVQLIWRLNNHYQRRLKTVLKAQDLSYLQYSILVELAALPRGAAYSYEQLALQLGVNRMTMARAIRKLRGKALLRNYYRDMFDQRAWVVAASNPVTYRTIRALEASMRVLEDEIRELLGPEDVRALVGLYENRPSDPVPRARATWWKCSHDSLGRPRW